MPESTMIVLIVAGAGFLAGLAYLFYLFHQINKDLRSIAKNLKRPAVVEPVVTTGPPRFDQYEIKPPDPFPASLGLCMFTAPRMHV